ncbi:MAG TPA: hypothetical protein VHB21_27650 [Minicystis sp.]|nr:hypothetical protein [Minicystis sp.]
MMHTNSGATSDAASSFGAIPDRGIDVPARRPGVPMETAPALVGAARPGPIERQVPRAGLLHRMELAELTPVFGTAQPAKGLSGMLRAAAYRVPEHLARHWLLLLAADRVDVVEHRLGRASKWLPYAVPVVAFAAVAARRKRPFWARVFA